MRIGASSGASSALSKSLRSACGKASQIGKSPVMGLAVLSPLVLAAAVGAGGPTVVGQTPPVQSTDVAPLAAIAPTPPPDTSGPAVIAMVNPPASFRVAAATTSAPPPATVVSAPGALRIPSIALSAYRNAESMMARAVPGCGVSWNLLAGIGRIESGHANNGATDVRGTAVNPIYGPVLDGTLPGNEVIVQSVQAGRVTYARALGPMQFLPSTWSRYASDGDNDGKADPQNVYDAALAAARYLCSGSMNLRDQNQVLTAVLRYNNSMAYARNVLGWAGAYATGVAPIDLPPITGEVPELVVTEVSQHHLADPEGLGPDLPLHGVGADPLADLTRVDLPQTDVANRLPVPPGPEAGDLPSAPCAVFCITEAPAAPAPWTPPWMQPAAPAPAPWTPPWMQPAPIAPLAPAGPAPGPAEATPAPARAPGPANAPAQAPAEAPNPAQAPGPAPAAPADPAAPAAPEAAATPTPGPVPPLPGPAA